MIADLLIHEATVLTGSKTGVDASNCSVFAWTAAALPIACRFVNKEKRFFSATEGVVRKTVIRLFVLPAVTLTDTHRIRSTEPGFVGDFAVTAAPLLTADNPDIDHYEVELEVVPA